jgi:uncharacterized protein
MTGQELPPDAAWVHREARQGFEVVFFDRQGAGYRFGGHTTAVEDGQAWAVGYEIVVDDRWAIRHAHITGRSPLGRHEVRLETDGQGHWQVDGAAAPHLDGCLDVDLESSACTNTLPVHRLRLALGESAEAPAAYVRAANLDVERLEQSYLRLDDEARHQRYDYRSPVFDFRATLVYDPTGLILTYPGIATRAR